MDNIKTKKNTFDSFMRGLHETYLEGVREQPISNEEYDALNKPYSEWFDDFSYEEICDHADLFAEELHNVSHE